MWTDQRFYALRLGGHVLSRHFRYYIPEFSGRIVVQTPLAVRWVSLIISLFFSLCDFLWFLLLLFSCWCYSQVLSSNSDDSFINSNMCRSICCWPCWLLFRVLVFLNLILENMVGFAMVFFLLSYILGVGRCYFRCVVVVLVIFFWISCYLSCWCICELRAI